MSNPFRNSPPEEVLPYAPNWARQPGQRPVQPSVAYDAFSDEENPSYREMAQMFSPQSERPKAKRANPTTKMLVRFGAVVGVAGAAIALFIGYVATQPGAKDVSANHNEQRFKGVNTAVAAVQAAFTSSPSNEPPVAPVVETPRVPEKVPEPASVTAAAAVSTDQAPRRLRKRPKRRRRSLPGQKWRRSPRTLPPRQRRPFRSSRPESSRP